MYRYFQTKKQHEERKRKSEEDKKPKKEKKQRKQPRSSFFEYLKKRETQVLSQIYVNIRYWIHLKGNIPNYLQVYTSPSKNREMLSFTELPHDKKLQSHIDNIVSKKHP